jgi:hypothetical protein
MNAFEAARQAQYSEHVMRPLTDHEPVFLLVPATQNDVRHFGAKSHTELRFSSDSLFVLGACVGFTMAPVYCGVIQVGRHLERAVGEPYVCEVWNCVHEIVPGIKVWLYRRAIHAARSLGFQSMLHRRFDDDQSFLEPLGFSKAQRTTRWKGWVLDLVHAPNLRSDELPTALPARPEQPQLPSAESIDV